LAVESFASIEALKGTSLIVSQMFSVGALFIPCIVGIFFFDEPMSVWQWVGLALFVAAMYFMVSPTKEKEKTTTKITAKTICMLLLMLFAGGGTMVAQKAFAKIVPNGNVAAYSFLMFALNAVILYACYAGSIFGEKKKRARRGKTTERLVQNVARMWINFGCCGLRYQYVGDGAWKEC
jgi:drug/metabolite transporter (DMT)-like permease